MWTKCVHKRWTLQWCNVHLTMEKTKMIVVGADQDSSTHHQRRRWWCLCTSCCSCRCGVPSPLFPESLLLSCLCAVRSGSLIAMSGIDDWSNVSVIRKMQQCHISLFAASWSFNSYNLFVLDLAFDFKNAGSGNLCGCLPSYASAPARQPLFCFLSFCHFLRLVEGMSEPGIWNTGICV